MASTTDEFAANWSCGSKEFLHARRAPRSLVMALALSILMILLFDTL